MGSSTESKIEVRSYTPLPKQREFHQSRAMLRAYIGGFGAGKTLAGVWEAIDVSMQYARNWGVICRKTYRELKDTTQACFFEACPRELIERYSVRDEAVTLVNGSKVVFRSLDRESVDKLKSTNLGWWYIDEASEIEDEDIPTMLVGRLRLAGVGWRGGWITSNPPHVEHWIYKWFVKRAAEAPDRYHLVQASSYENPHLPKEYIEALREEYSPQWVRRYLEGQFGFLASGSPVYSEFSRDTHVRDVKWVEGRPVVRSWDFGYHHPAVLWCQRTSDGLLLVLNEYMGTRVLLHQFADRVVQLSNDLFPGAVFVDVGDPAGKALGDKDVRSSVDILREHGITLRFRQYPKRRLIERLDMLFARTRRIGDEVVPVVQISPRCEVLIEGLEGGYCWPKSGTREHPVEDGYYEHLQDCLQYAYAHLYMGGATGGTSVDVRVPSWRI